MITINIFRLIWIWVLSPETRKAVFLKLGARVPILGLRENPKPSSGMPRKPVLSLPSLLAS